MSSHPEQRQPLVVRPARPEDAATIAGLIHKLAEYERLADECRVDAAALARGLFGERPYAEALVAERAGRPSGYAIFFYTFSSFEAAPSLYLEDLFVEPAARRCGVGRALLEQVARVAVERGCRRMEWAVLDWNRPAMEFYERLGARAMSEWTTYRLDAEAMRRLAGGGGGGGNAAERLARPPHSASHS